MEERVAERINENRKTWDKVSDLFINASALPVWAPFGVGDDLNLLPEISGKTFLEIGCGSGRSIKYLTDRGASRVYGLDVSEAQVQECKRYNQPKVDAGDVRIFQGSMEEHIDIELVDYAVSIYGFGWTQEPEKTLRHIFSYIKPGGRFIWSWDHSFFTDVIYKDEKFVVEHSYHDEKPIAIKDWRKPGCIAYITYRKIDTWFRLQQEAGFQIVGYHEPGPKNLDRAHNNPEKYYSIQKAEKVPASFIFVCQRPFV